MPAQAISPIQTNLPNVQIETTARLHMGFVDLNGSLGRRFGSIGLSLDRPSTRLRAVAAESFTAEGAAAARVLDLARTFAEGAGISGGAHFQIDEAIPDHAGLGSGTQMGLAVGTALSRLYGLDLTTREIAALTGRGRRSGIGIGAFDMGGLLVDGGRSADTLVPPIISRIDFPETWRVLLVCDRLAQGVHGQAEIRAFGELPSFLESQAAEIARLILMQALPAACEADLPAFGAAISRIQEIVGRHFAPAQGGGLYVSSRVAEAMQWLQAQGVTCTGQSSWGPTGFAVMGDADLAEALLEGLAQRFPAVEGLVCRARNHGARVSGA